MLPKSIKYKGFYKIFTKPFIYKIKLYIYYMKKNSADIFSPVEIDPISGQYFITIPEQVINELEWYEDTQIKFTLDGKEVILSESN